MKAWLEKYIVELLLLGVGAVASGWVGLNKRRERQLKESRRRIRKLTAELDKALRDLNQSREFNFKDRWTILEMAKMIRDMRKKLGEPDGDIILELNDKAESEMRARRLAAGIHTTTTSMADEGSYSDD
jgi:hypothetical protein